MNKDDYDRIAHRKYIYDLGVRILMSLGWNRKEAEEETTKQMM